MVRSQIQLTKDQHRRLKRLAERMGVSMSELVRRCVADRLTAEETSPTRDALVQSALAVCGKYEDDVDDTAQQHDRHLSDAFSS